MLGQRGRELLLQEADEHGEHCGEDGVDRRAAEEYGEACCGKDASQVERHAIGGLVDAALYGPGELIDARGFLATLFSKLVEGGDDTVVRRSRCDDAPCLCEPLAVGKVHRDHERRRDGEHVHGACPVGSSDAGKRAFHAGSLRRQQAAWPRPCSKARRVFRCGFPWLPLYASKLRSPSFSGIMREEDDAGKEAVQCFACRCSNQWTPPTR